MLLPHAAWSLTTVDHILVLRQLIGFMSREYKSSQ